MNVVKQQANSRSLQDVARSYAAQGYKVVVHPQKADLPESLTVFQPHLVALRDEDNVVVEVKSREALTEAKYMPRLAAAVEGLPHWRLDLVVVGPEPLDHRYQINPPDLRRRLDTAERLLAAGDTEAALLVLWSATEGSLRLFARQEKLELGDDSPGTLVRDLATLGYIERPEYNALQKAMSAREAIVHGFSTSKADPTLVRRLLRIASQRLSQVEVNVNGMGGTAAAQAERSTAAAEAARTAAQ